MGLQHSCRQQGCYYKKNLPKFDVFADCFKGKVNFTDIDAMVQRGNYYIVQEWKKSAPLKRGQERMLQHMTKTFPFHIVAMFVDGDAETMEVEKVSVFIGGIEYGPCMCGINDLKELVKGWDEATLEPDLMDVYCTWVKELFSEYKGQGIHL